MNHSHSIKSFSGLWAMAVIGGLWSILATGLCMAQPNETGPKPATGQRVFSSPDEAIKALQEATQAKDRSGMRALFGPELDHLLTGDEVQDAKNHEKFAAALAQACKPVPEGDDKVTLEVGTNEWPMPIPLVKVDGQWHFDTDAGKEEVIARHIGKDELHAIGLCRAYVKAQQQYAGSNTGYAEKLASLGGPLAEAQEDGQPLHGYYFRILTRQGPAAPGGKKKYTSGGALTGGFALVAYPENWDQSGIMTFIVNQDGTVYERNLGEKSAHLGKRMKEYNPDNDWKAVQDEGILSATSENITH